MGRSVRPCVVAGAGAADQDEENKELAEAFAQAAKVGPCPLTTPASPQFDPSLAPA
jgi:hypothetical protein